MRFFETSFGRVYDRTFLVTKLDGEGASAYGECVADDNPYYSSETTDTAWQIISQFLVPLVLGVPFDHPREVFPAMHRVRGHHMAKAAIEMAAWDLFARQQGVPLRHVLGGVRDARLPQACRLASRTRSSSSASGWPPSWPTAIAGSRSR